VVLIDLGAGTSYNILDFFLLSDVSILAVVPEPTSIENGYRFIKSALYRRLRAAASTESARQLVDAALDPRSPLGIRSPAQLLARLELQDPESTQAMRREVAAFQPRFVVNEVRDMADVAIGHQLVAACGRHLGVKASYAGFIHHDDAVWQAVRRRRLFMADAPTSRAAEEIRQLTRGLVKGESLGTATEPPPGSMTGGSPDLSAVLGLEPRASREQVERAYRFCLDLYGEGSIATYSLLEPAEAEQQRVRVREAYEVLADEASSGHPARPWPPPQIRQSSLPRQTRPPRRTPPKAERADPRGFARRTGSRSVTSPRSRRSASGSSSTSRRTGSISCRRRCTSGASCRSTPAWSASSRAGPPTPT
jgi:MinD-like ATPase involved in chromosome partitioning or flagellar assembly